jgi:hypothetical protein
MRATVPAAGGPAAAARGSAAAVAIDAAAAVAAIIAVALLTGEWRMLHGSIRHGVGRVPPVKLTQSSRRTVNLTVSVVNLTT